MLYPLTGGQTGRYSLSQSRPLLRARSGPFYLRVSTAKNTGPETRGGKARVGENALKQGLQSSSSATNV